MANVLVVTAFGYEKLEKMINNLTEKFPDIEFEFYIINETFQKESSANIKYPHYISLEAFEMTSVKELLENFPYEWPNMDFAIQTDEYAIYVLAMISSKFGLKGISVEHAHCFRDKVRMKQRLGNDICKPKLYNIEDVRYGLISYPVIVKPRTFAASHGVYIVQNQDELYSKIENKEINYDRDSIDTLEDIEIEEFIDAEICHIDGLVFDGEIVFCNASKYIGSCFDYAKGKTLGSINLLSDEQQQALEFVKKIHRDLIIPNGAFHLECFYRDGEFVFLEIGMRPGGVGIVPSIEAATGINLADEHIYCQLGISPKINVDMSNKYFGYICFPKQPNGNSDKFVKSIKFPDGSHKSLYSSVIPKSGENAIIKNIMNYEDTLGNFIFVSNNRHQIEADIDAYLNGYIVVLS
ncbi:MAG: ATP-grasp domain-containing protein [Defluviitaleaceae bacterium]|nr:ATP-grasp domain-containing protein [Defluviitaleaceae bacterium]